MRHVIALSVSIAALMTVTAAQAQDGRSSGPLRLDVRPRSFLDAGKVVSPYSSVNPASAYGQTVSYLTNPPYVNMRDRFGAGTLPDPVTNGPFVGARSVLDPIDFASPGFDD
jgi:hypothetical protein